MFGIITRRIIKMKIEVILKGEIDKKDFDKVRGLVNNIETLTIWCKKVFNIEEVKQK